MKARQAGFTLIELIVVIVILGILAATALPKFVDLGGDARTSVIKATEGAMRSANAMIYAKAAAANKMSGTASNVTIVGKAVSVTYGFATNMAALRLVMDLSSDITVSGQVVQHTGATTVGSTCGVTYGAATGAAAPPTYTTLTGGC